MQGFVHRSPLTAVCIGLLQLLGYARKTAEGWSYSPAALELLRDFLQRCPALFSYLRDHPQDDSYYEADLFPEAEG